MKRLPLSSIDTNVASPVSLKDHKLFQKNGDDAKNGFTSGTLVSPFKEAECNSRRCSNELIGEGFNVQKVGLSLVGGSIMNSCITPLRQQDRSYECESSSNSTLIKSLVFPETNVSISTSNFLGDDFDESILEQIDAICEQKSSLSSERADSAMEKKDTGFVIKSCEEDITLVNVSDEMSKSEDILDYHSADDEACRVKELGKLENELTKNMSEDILDSHSADDEACGVKEFGKSENELTKNMPDEYAKYIRSLNDKQQEAACTDISIPLVIVAGPGSGKVYFSPIF